MLYFTLLYQFIKYFSAMLYQNVVPQNKMKQRKLQIKEKWSFSFVITN